MGAAKNIEVKLIKSSIANAFIKQHHYSGKVVANSQVHFGCFLNGQLHGVMSYGPSMTKQNMLGLVAGTGWNDFLELNRMAFDAFLPRNSESRCIAISLRMIRKQAPHIKWVISYADCTQCGDGTIYRASGFVLTDIKVNTQLRIHPETKEPIHAITAYHHGEKREFSKWEKLPGYQLRYIYLIDKSCKINVPIIPFSEIDKIGAGMYRGKKVSILERRNNTGVKHKINASAVQVEKGGVIPTHTLQKKVIKKW